MSVLLHRGRQCALSILVDGLVRIYHRGYLERLLNRQYPTGWHSFDRTPWRHPWLSRGNLEDMRAFSRRILDEAAAVAAGAETGALRFAFVGNMANSSYQRMRALRQLGFEASLFPHPGDTSLTSQPEWEEYADVLPEGVSTLAQLRESASVVPDVPDVVRLADNGDWRLGAMTQKHARISDIARWPHYFAYAPILEALQEMSALYAVQVPYLAYLSRRPYVATHMGGDIWYECARGDALGSLQRQAFRRASALTISNPWSPAFARRYGFRNMVILPMILNTERYCRGAPRWRAEWQSRIGGDFFVLCTARLDDRYKGSNLALAGFARLAASNPGARLVVIAWGADMARHQSAMQEMGIADRVLYLSPSGKVRLLEYLSSADCLLDQFVLGYFGLTALEAMSTGLPVVMRLEAGQYDAFLTTGAPPVLNAATESEVADALRRLADEPAYRREVAARSLDWFGRSASPHAWGKAYRDLLVAAAVGHRFDFRDSPLNAPLGRDEREYHANELQHAPAFPAYH